MLPMVQAVAAGREGGTGAATPGPTYLIVCRGGATTR